MLTQHRRLLFAFVLILGAASACSGTSGTSAAAAGSGGSTGTGAVHRTDGGVGNEGGSYAKGSGW